MSKAGSAGRGSKRLVHTVENLPLRMQLSGTQLSLTAVTTTAVLPATTDSAPSLWYTEVCAPLLFIFTTTVEGRCNFPIYQEKLQRLSRAKGACQRSGKQTVIALGCGCLETESSASNHPPSSVWLDSFRYTKLKPEVKLQLPKGMTGLCLWDHLIYSG